MRSEEEEEDSGRVRPILLRFCRRRATSMSVISGTPCSRLHCIGLMFQRPEGVSTAASAKEPVSAKKASTLDTVGTLPEVMAHERSEMPLCSSTAARASCSVINCKAQSRARSIVSAQPQLAAKPASGRQVLAATGLPAEASKTLPRPFMIFTSEFRPRLGLPSLRAHSSSEMSGSSVTSSGAGSLTSKPSGASHRTSNQAKPSPA
mmetsp:Transcript_27069/g.76329  ORF Transcript_27069/g.76329 Transcript_27069/m.76329 type:complete len:206 (+) Transcript_27069:470-1087(+)